MAIDIRATVTCSLGTLISASLSDDYVQGTGLIKCKGSCEINGLITPAPGTVVAFSYTKGGVTRTIPRQVLVISSFADPLRRTTKVELGCRFTYLQNKKDRIQWDQYDDPENADVTAAETAIVTFPIYAVSVAAKCMAELGVTGSPALTNVFSVAEFDFSPGYVNVLSDLLVSECQCGYIDQNGDMQIFNLNVSGGTGPVIDSTKIIDISDIGVGQPSGDAVVVSYSTLKLNDPESNTLTDPEAPANPGDQTEKTTEEQLRDWELDEVIGTTTSVTVSFKKPDNSLEEYNFTYIPYQSTKTEYDAWDRVVKRTTVDRKIGAVTNPGYIQASAEYDFANGALAAGATAVGYGSSVKETTTETIIQYRIRPSSLPPSPDGTPFNFIGSFDTLEDLPETGQQNDVATIKDQCYERYSWNGSWETLPAKDTEQQPPLPEGYDEVELEITTVTEPIDAVLGAASPSFVDDNNNFISLPSGENVISSRTTTIYDQQGRSISFALDAANTSQQQLNIPVTKTITKREKAYAYTAYGQQDLAKRAEQGQTINEYKSSASILVDDGAEVRLVSGREATLQTRPSKQQQILANAAKTSGSGSATPSAADENGGYSVSSKSELELAVGGLGSQNRIELSLPYAPDDTFTRIGTCPGVIYSAFPSDAPSKAANFGRTQNRMLLGNRYGMNIQLAPEHLPAAPFAPIMVQLAGLTALYRINGTSWTMSGEGIVASTDAMFWGAVGGTGTFWFPVAPGITTLPATPAVVDGQMTVTNVVPVWNETVKTEATTFVGLTITSLSYALSVLTEVPTLTTKTDLIAARIRKVPVPAASLATAAQAPTVSSGASLKPPAVSTAVAASPVQIFAGASVSVPSTAVSLASFAPESAGPVKTQVLTPSANLALGALLPSVSVGASLTVPSKEVSVASFAPTVSLLPTDPSFASVSLLLHLDGSDGGSTFTDNSSNAFIVTRGGNAELDTAVKKFGTAAVIWDGSGDFLRTPSDADFTFGTGDFTIEFWSYFDASFNTGAAAILMSIGAFRNITYTASTLRFRTDGGTNLITGNALSLSTWYHIALTKSGNDHRLFVDGTQQGSTYTSTTSYTADRITFGANNTGTFNYLGSMDEIRVTTGVARYTANFTAPTQAFPDS